MEKIIRCGPYQLDYQSKTIMMGIVNATPDSFSDGGKYNEISAAVNHAEQLVRDGADIIDIGGESTRPGHEPVPADEEISRVQPLIRSLVKTVKVPVSIDTYKSKTAAAAIEAGALMINDVWGAKKDPEIAAVAAEHKVPIVLMHNREDRDYQSFIRDVLNDLYESITIVKKAGVDDDMIILDPGIGFAKGYREDMMMMQNLDKIVALGYPVLLATSRKRTIGTTLNLPVEERLEGTGATVCFGIQKGCHMMRVHDVKEISRMAAMTDALMGKGRDDG